MFQTTNQQLYNIIKNITVPCSHAPVLASFRKPRKSSMVISPEPSRSILQPLNIVEAVESRNGDPLKNGIFYEQNGRYHENGPSIVDFSIQNCDFP